LRCDPQQTHRPKMAGGCAENAPVSRIPISFFTGFLGSGKTTLISALLRQPDMARTAVVVNEFGEVGLDDAIFADASESSNIRLLANGCMCCVAGDDLQQTLHELITAGQHPPARIVIETTGLADPTNLMKKIMLDLKLRARFRLDGVVATIDAVNGAENLRKHHVSRCQVAVADLRVITKSDLSDDTDVLRLHRELISLNPGAKTIVVKHGEVDARKLFGLSLVDHRTGLADLQKWLNADAHRLHQQGKKHGDGIRAWLIEEDNPVDWDKLSPKIGSVIERHGYCLLRLKGVVRTRPDERPLVLHGVQRTFHAPVRLGKWPGQPKTSLVAIGSQEARPAIDALRAALSASAA